MAERRLPNRIARRFQDGPGFRLRPDRRMPDHITLLCQALLPWAESVLATRIGPDAAEYGGTALYQALRQYQPVFGVPLRPYLIDRLYWVARDEMRRAGLWSDTAAAKAASRTTALIDDQQYSAPAVEAVDGDIAQRDEMISLARRMNQLGDELARMVGLGLVLGGGGLGATDIARAMNVSISTVRNQIAVVRRSL